jgi:T-complex protein 1 subunit theta
VKRVENAKVTVFGCGIEASSTEAKGTVLIRTAEELMNYNKSEEKLMEEVRCSHCEAY